MTGLNVRLGIRYRDRRASRVGSIVKAMTHAGLGGPASLISIVVTQPQSFIIKVDGHGGGLAESKAGRVFSARLTMADRLRLVEGADWTVQAEWFVSRPDGVMGRRKRGQRL